MSPHPFFRDSFVGQIIYYLSGKKLLQYPDERDDYVVPDKYFFHERRPSETSQESSDSATSGVTGNDSQFIQDGQQEEDEEDKDKDSDQDEDPTPNEDPVDVENEKQQGLEPVMIEWDGPDDPENPYNWPLRTKIFFIFEVCFLTTSVYMGSAIFTPSINEIMVQFNVSQVAAVLPLSMFVIGYGFGPMLLSPLSEHPAIGRMWIYIITLMLFVIFQIPAADAQNFGTLLVVRLLGGIFASPALATGGASIGDVVHMPYLPIGIAAWSVGAVCGPVLGPLIGSVFAQLVNWRWTFWFMTILSGSTLAVLMFLMPETNQDTLLYRKCLRMRKRTGNQFIMSHAHQIMAEMTVKEVLKDTFWRPIEIAFGEPVIFFLNSFTALMYATIYLFFESFPIVFVEVHHFTLVELGVSYLSVAIGVLVGVIIYIPIVHRRYTIPMLRGEQIYPEVHLPMSIAGSVLMPIGLFIFAWTAREDIHWVAPLIGAGVYACGAFMNFQAIFNYLGSSFYRYLASVFAGNDMFRSGTAAAFPIFAHALYVNTGSDRYPVGWGTSIIGFISVAMILIPIALVAYGKQLRARSRYAN